MTLHIFSKIQPEKLLHIVYEPGEFNNRVDIAPDDQFLQVAMIKPAKGKKYDRHYHLWKTPTFDKHIAQESWIVLSGAIKVSYYDLDNQLLIEKTIESKGCSITFEGGHSYEILDDDTIVYEFKTGPYTGRENDKEFF